MYSILAIALSLLVGYCLLMLVVFLGQRKLIYHPPLHKSAERYVRSVGLTEWQTKDGAFIGYIPAHPPASAKGTIVLFHGNAGSAADRYYYAQALVPLGYTVVLPEYPGYAGKPGKPSESQFVSDAKVVLQRAQEAFDGPLYVWGESLGCGVAAAVAADTDVPVKGLMLLMPWDTLPDLAQRLYWYFPARWFVRDRFDNIEHLRDFPGPVAVAVAENDEIIAPKHSLRLYETLRTRKRLWTFSGATHNDWPTDPDESWWTEVMDFLSSAEPTNSGQD